MAKFSMQVNTDNGTVCAEFESQEELEKFQDSLKAKEDERIKAEKAREAEERKAEEEKFETVKSSVDVAVTNAKDAGMPPEYVVRLFREAMVHNIDGWESEGE